MHPPTYIYCSHSLLVNNLIFLHHICFEKMGRNRSSSNFTEYFFGSSEKAFINISMNSLQSVWKSSTIWPLNIDTKANCWRLHEKDKKKFSNIAKINDFNRLLGIIPEIEKCFHLNWNYICIPNEVHIQLNEGKWKIEREKKEL